MDMENINLPVREKRSSSSIIAIRNPAKLLPVLRQKEKAVVDSKEEYAPQEHVECIEVNMRME